MLLIVSVVMPTTFASNVRVAISVLIVDLLALFVLLPAQIAPAMEHAHHVNLLFTRLHSLMERALYVMFLTVQLAITPTQVTVSLVPNSTSITIRQASVSLAARPIA
jgi:hypothetical protein